MVVVESGCNSTAQRSFPPVSYGDLCGFQKADFGVMDDGQVLSRIRDKYHVNPQKEVVANSVVYSWQSGRTVSEVGLLNGRLFAAKRRDIDNGDTLGSVVAGLGAPETLYRYATVFEGVQYTIGLEYPSQGITLMTYRVAGAGEVKRDGETLLVHVSEGLRVTDINCYLPNNSLDDYLREVYRVPPESMEMQKRRRVPWPGFDAWVPLE